MNGILIIISIGSQYNVTKIAIGLRKNGDDFYWIRSGKKLSMEDYDDDSSSSEEGDCAMIKVANHYQLQGIIEATPCTSQVNLVPCYRPNVKQD